ncbi:hypothetical protein U1Q18_044165, partial [Sarracenia purpurea var. burkii]
PNSPDSRPIPFSLSPSPLCLQPSSTVSLKFTHALCLYLSSSVWHMQGFLTSYHLRRLRHHVPALSLSLVPALLSTLRCLRLASALSFLLCFGSNLLTFGASMTRPAPSKLESTTFSVAVSSTALVWFS